MFQAWWLVTLAVVVVGAALVVIGVAVWRSTRRRAEEQRLAKARREFHQQRERLEAKFFQISSSSGKPRGLEWTGCDFDNDVVYVRDRKSGELLAFVGVAISFAAIEGGGMEDVEAVSNIRAATAVFRMQRQWSTDGRAIFNLNPTEAARHFDQDVEMVEHEIAHSARS